VPNSGKPRENFSTLNQHFAGILNVADSADSAPTVQATNVANELNVALADLLQRWEKLRRDDLVALNSLLRSSGLVEINADTPPEEPPSGGAGGDDEP
jgi:hypothetical protein